MYREQYGECEYSILERASESEINWTDQTPGTFRSRLVFKPVYPNSPNTRENVRGRVVAVS